MSDDEWEMIDAWRGPDRIGDLAHRPFSMNHQP
jgi:hypothetical protein